VKAGGSPLSSVGSKPSPISSVRSRRSSTFRLRRTRSRPAFDLHCELRNALVPLGQHARLLEVLKAAEALAKKIGDERRLAQIYSFLSNYYGNVGHSDFALEAGERSLVLSERLGPPICC
jgi:hypothetical protein